MRRPKEKKGIEVARSKPLRPKVGRYSRTKGNTFERNTVLYFKALGYERVKTSRLASRLLDSAKVDLCNIPLNIQCKAVEANINYRTLTEEIADNINKLIPERNDLPIIIFHKKNRQGTNVIMTLDEFTKLFKMIKNGTIFQSRIEDTSS